MIRNLMILYYVSKGLERVHFGQLLGFVQSGVYFSFFQEEVLQNFLEL